jgi:hypothetical protein
MITSLKVHRLYPSLEESRTLPITGPEEAFPGFEKLEPFISNLHDYFITSLSWLSFFKMSRIQQGIAREHPVSIPINLYDICNVYTY